MGHPATGAGSSYSSRKRRPRGAGPANAIVSFTASATSVAPGTAVTLTATAGYNVGTSPYVIEIFDLATGGRIGYCWYGTTCSVSVTNSSPAFGRYQAYVAPLGNQPPLNPAGISDEVDVSWSAIAVSLNLTNTGFPYIMTAVAALDVGPTPWFIEIYDLTTGQRMASCGYCTTCSYSYYPPTGSSAHTFQAFIASYSATPPTSYQGVSNYLSLGSQKG